MYVSLHGVGNHSKDQWFYPDTATALQEERLVNVPLRGVAASARPPNVRRWARPYPDLVRFDACTGDSPAHPQGYLQLDRGLGEITHRIAAPATSAARGASSRSLRVATSRALSAARVPTSARSRQLSGVMEAAQRPRTPAGCAPPPSSWPAGWRVIEAAGGRGAVQRARGGSGAGSAWHSIGAAATAAAAAAAATASTARPGALSSRLDQDR